MAMTSILHITNSWAKTTFWEYNINWRKLDNRGLTIIKRERERERERERGGSEKGRERKRCGGNSLNCPGWTRAVWGIVNGYIYQYHWSILGTDNLYCFLCFNHKSIYLDAQNRLLFWIYLCTASNMNELMLVDSLSSPRRSTSRVMLQYCAIDWRSSTLRWLYSWQIKKKW